MTSLVAWLIFIHVASAFVFAAGHGVSVFVAFRLRGERDMDRQKALSAAGGSGSRWRCCSSSAA